MDFRITTAPALLAGMLLFTPTLAGAATLEEQAKSLERSVKTVEQRRKEALADLNTHVLRAYRDAIQITSVDTDVAEVFDRTVRVRVVVTYAVDFERARQVRSTLSQYFTTNTDKEVGVEPYGMIYTNFDDCVGEFCAVKKETTRFLKNSGVGINVSFLSNWETGLLMNGSGRYELKPGKFTFLIDVPKHKLKGDPKPVVKGQIYDVHYCDGNGGCDGVTFSQR
ncbi:hypothetical protein RBE51_19975 [Pseudomonas taiwanensis]|uniref:hypothetical protein n=1 Tax=Pseudomonas taiwanensis TaxID=470150 RepID=UPI0028DFF0C2|nr:hypothetical protein [Pseudomonas taiwanensis]MDT8925071.1 hypothetical protein [Pseudomonas taiwanensis]